MIPRNKECLGIYVHLRFRSIGFQCCNYKFVGIIRNWRFTFFLSNLRMECEEQSHIQMGHFATLPIQKLFKKILLKNQSNKRIKQCGASRHKNTINKSRYFTLNLVSRFIWILPMSYPRYTVRWIYEKQWVFLFFMNCFWNIDETPWMMFCTSLIDINVPLLSLAQLILQTSVNWLLRAISVHASCSFPFHSACKVEHPVGLLVRIIVQMFLVNPFSCELFLWYCNQKPRQNQNL